MDYDATTNFDGTWRYFDPIAIDELFGPLLHDTTITNGLDTDIYYFFAYCYSVLQGIEEIVVVYQTAEMSFRIADGSNHKPAARDSTKCRAIDRLVRPRHLLHA